MVMGSDGATITIDHAPQKAARKNFRPEEPLWYDNKKFSKGELIVNFHLFERRTRAGYP